MKELHSINITERTNDPTILFVALLSIEHSLEIIFKNTISHNSMPKFKTKALTTSTSDKYIQIEINDC